jgi:BirA family transcriptional regulator, biotin operon repressor / biotin---[acetyl-CoA-carboxylase] ligase
MTFEALHLKARWLGCQRIELESCGSTNDEAARLARAGARHGTVVIAERQTAGRGRDGRAWQSPPGGLYLSAIVRPPLPIVDVPPMTLAIGIGLCDAIRFAGAPASLKWPNDVLLDGKKLAGVLVEAQSQGNKLESVVVGIGINLDGELPDDVAETATTLADASGTRIDREAFIAHLLADVERWIDRYVGVGLEAIIPAWHDRMALGLAARATVDGASLVGEVAGLDHDGALLLRDADGGVHRVRSGDVEVLRSPASRVMVATSAAAL